MYADTLKKTLFATTVTMESKGLYISPKNKLLTLDDVEGAISVMVKVEADTHYPMFVIIDKDKLNDIENGSRKVTFWYYMLEDFTELLDKPDENYHIVIGDVYYVYD